MQAFIGIDVGGTFTDFSVVLPGGAEILHKVASTPAEPDAAIVQGLAEIFSAHRIDTARIMRLAHGTTIGTNALIQRRVGKVGMITTRGFRDLLEIGRQIRPKVYDIHLDNPKPLIPGELRQEVTERLRADGAIHKPLAEQEVAQAARQLSTEGVDCIIVCFLHAHAFPDHEDRAARIAREIAGPHIMVITSSSVYPEFREYERFSTTVLNAALLTVMHAYLERLGKTARRLGLTCAPTVSQSSGGLMSLDMARRLPVRNVLSGPAAGVIGAATRAAAAGFSDVITLDVGGTSADVALINGGKPALVGSRMLAGFPIRLPTLDVNSVGAGGGSIAWIDRDGLLKVGPQSAGAMPGPACYNCGGNEATVTDADVLLGRLNDIALLDGRMPISRTRAEQAISSLGQVLGLDTTETALGIARLAAATIVKAIRAISVERGSDPAAFALFAFGGAGPLHATEVARELDIGTVIVPPSPGILCAQGLLNSDLVADFVRAALLPAERNSAPAFSQLRQSLAAQAAAWFASEKIPAESQRSFWTADLRYRGQNFELSIPISAQVELGAPELAASFHAAHERAYGFAQPTEVIELVSLRVTVSGVLQKPDLPLLADRQPALPIATRLTLFAPGVWRNSSVFHRSELTPGQTIPGPAIIEQMDATTPIWPGDVGRLDPSGNLIITLSPVP